MTGLPHLTPAPDVLRTAASALADALQTRGYDAHANVAAVGVVEIRAIHIAGWRYPDGHWQWREEPVLITADQDCTANPHWWLDNHRRERVVVPHYGSADAVAEWLSYELPSPDHPTTRLERHPDSLDAESGAIPVDWFYAWQAATPHEPNPSLQHHPGPLVPVEATCCLGLEISAPADRPEPAGDTVAFHEFVLIHTPSKLWIAAAEKPDPLHDLAARLAWFNEPIVDPGYLAETHRAEVASSLAHILTHWRGEGAHDSQRQILLFTPS